jgi:hypothetical protein
MEKLSGWRDIRCSNRSRSFRDTTIISVLSPNDMSVDVLLNLVLRVVCFHELNASQFSKIYKSKSNNPLLSHFTSRWANEIWGRKNKMKCPSTLATVATLVLFQGELILNSIWFFASGLTLLHLFDYSVPRAVCVSRLATPWPPPSKRGKTAQNYHFYF